LASTDHVLITHGGTGAVFVALAATLNPGDRVLIPSPAYSIFPDLVRFVGAVPVPVPLRWEDNHFDIDELAASARGARMLIVCNPCNPTGVVFTADELARVAAIADEHDLLVVADEVYDRIVFNDAFKSMLEIPELSQRLLYVQSFSKTYAMAGMRVGYLAAPAWAAPACVRAHRTASGSINQATQQAAIAALDHGEEWLANALSEYVHRREVVLSTLRMVGGINARPPDGTLFTWVRYQHRIASEALAEIAVAHGVAIRAGSEFGRDGEGHFSIALAVGGEQLEEALRRLVAALQATITEETE
jgi:aspartate/methionine/tyrosine aminotransferase